MRRDHQKWTRDQTLIAFNLYCKLPFSKVDSNNPEIINIAKVIGRSPSSLNMKIANLASFDPELKKRGIKGLVNASKLDREIWDEFNDNWEELSFESERVLSRFEGKDILDKSALDDENFTILDGLEKERVVKTRVNQRFFRQTVLSAYNNTCCISGIDVPALLIASHIIPWSVANKNRLNPRNGLCLNALHDKAFDKGLLTITTEFKIKISSRILEGKNASVESWIASFDGKDIISPERFLPDIRFIEYHNRNIFQP